MEGNIGLGRKLAAATASAVVLWLAPNAVAANQLLETLNVDPANTAVTTGTVQLKQGTEYQLQVSGTFTLANGFGQSFEEDALFCFGDSGFTPAQCTPTPQRLGDFYIGSGPSSLKNIDAYQAPGGGGPPIGYGITHRYNVNFYPPANGPLTAGGTLAQSHCKSDPTPCTTTITGGPITIQIYGPGSGGGGGGGGGGAPSGWTIGGGIAIQAPAVLCRVQRGFPEASDVQAASGTGGVPIDPACVERKLLDPDQKQQLREDAKATLVYVLAFCGAAGDPKGRDILTANVALQFCRVAVELYLETATKLVNDPPDPHFTAPPGSAAPPPLARAAATACPSTLSRAQCAALRTALARYHGLLGLLDSTAGDIATGANRTTSAVAANALVPAFFQEAFAKVNEGAFAEDAAALKSDGRTLSAILRMNHLDPNISPSQAKSWLSKHPPSGLSKAQRTMVTAQLSSLSARKLSTLLSSSIPVPTFAASYQSTSLIDLASIINGLVVNGNLPTTAGQRLAADLTSVQSVCTNASQRIPAMNQFIADLHTYAQSVAQFLSFGAQPLLASTVPPTSCGTSPTATPTFTGTWNTSFGPMTLTQTGNQVTGTYADCPNNGATINGTVTGSALDGTWSEPCHSAQGLIHFVLSADGNSFTGLWGVGSATPTGTWNGTRAS